MGSRSKTRNLGSNSRARTERKCHLIGSHSPTDQPVRNASFAGFYLKPQFPNLALKLAVKSWKSDTGLSY
jgi:hypothetical protein